MNMPGFTAERAVQRRAAGFRRRSLRDRGSHPGNVRPAMDPLDMAELLEDIAARLSPESIAAFEEETEAMAWQDYWVEEEAFEKFAWEEAEAATAADMEGLAAGGELLIAVGIGVILGGAI